MSLMNAFHDLGGAIADTAGAGIKELQRADTLNTLQQGQQGFQAQQQQNQQTFQARENATHIQAEKDLQALKAQADQAKTRLENDLISGRDTELMKNAKFFGISGASGSSGAAPAAGATPTSYSDSGSFTDANAPPSPNENAATPGGATQTPGTTDALRASFLHKLTGAPEPGSDAETRLNLADDLRHDPYWGTKSAGERGLEIEARIASMKALERGGIYKFEPATAPDPNGPTGKETIPGFMRFNVKTGASDFIPTNTNPNKNAGGMGSRSELYFDRMMKATNLAVAAAGNIMELPEDASTGWFGGRQQGHTLMGAVKEALVNKVTSQQVQDYGVMIAGLARNLSNIETNGMAPPGSFTKSMGEGILIKEGDTQLTKLRKMAEVRQIVTEGMRDVFDNPKVPEVQKDALRKTLDTLQAVIPFTQHDLTELVKSKSGTTLADVVTSKGLRPGGGGSSDASGGASDTSSAPSPGNYLTPQQMYGGTGPTPARKPLAAFMPQQAPQ